MGLAVAQRDVLMYRQEDRELHGIVIFVVLDRRGVNDVFDLYSLE